MAADKLSVEDLEGIPLVFAYWLRYLMGVDDQGNVFTPSPDPLLDTLMPVLAEVKLGGAYDGKALLAPLLSRADIFGVDLNDSVLGEKGDSAVYGNDSGNRGSGQTAGQTVRRT